jgi:hypothetical protein
VSEASDLNDLVQIAREGVGQLTEIAASLKILAEAATPSSVTGVVPVFKGEEKTMKFCTAKKHAGTAPLKAHPKGVTPANITLQDNGKGLVTMLGTDDAGQQTDISALATLNPAPVSSDTTKLTFGAVAGVTVPYTCLGPLTTPGSPIQATFTVAWNDGSIGPFTATANVDIIAGPVSGVVPVFSFPPTP